MGNIITNSSIKKCYNKIYIIYKLSKKYDNNKQNFIKVRLDNQKISFIKIYSILLTKTLYYLLYFVPGNSTFQILFCLKNLFTIKKCLVFRLKNKFSDIIDIPRVKLVIVAKYLFFSINTCYCFMVYT